MNPVTRQEMFLNAAAGNEQALPDPVTREEVFLKAIVDAQGGGGGGLPSVSDADNGKVLTVVDGAWSPVAGGSSGGGVLVATADQITGALDKTWQQIHDADFAVVKDGNFTSPVFHTEVSGDSYLVYVLVKAGQEAMWYSYVADSADGYPLADD